MSVTVTTIPRELTERRQWVVWRWEGRDGKPTKPPYTVNGKLASSTDANTWVTFEEALTASREGGYNGVGFVFTEGDPFAGVDLDNCRHPVTGKIDPKSREIIDALNSYTEVSPSGTGLHVICRGPLPPGGRKRGTLEMYDSGRYFCVTGEHLEGTPLTIEERGEELAALHAKTFAKTEAKVTNTNVPAGGNIFVADAELLEKARAAKDGSKFTALRGGDWSGYPSQSEADQALCNILAFWTNRDAERIDRLFRQSGLYRQKWDERHYGDGRTYGQGTIERALELTTETYEPTRPSSNGATPQAPSRPDEPSEMTIAERMVDAQEGAIRYSWPQGAWYHFDGKRYARDDTGALRRMAKRAIRSLYQDAAEETDDKRRRRLAAYALKAETDAKVEGIIRLARSEPDVPILPDELDSDHYALNLLNGTIDLRSGNLRPHRRQDLITKLAQVKYDATAECRTFAAFLDHVMDGNEELIGFLQRATGYCLTGDVSEQALFLLYGTGANGKSTLLLTLLNLLGDYGRQAPPGLLTLRRHEEHPTQLADLQGARLVTSVEVDEGRRMAEAQVKWLSGGDRMKARRMRQDYFEYTPTAKLWLATNHKPVIRGTDDAIWRRIHLIPFSVAILPNERDPHLLDKLLAERSGILNWALQGCLQWQREGLNPPQEVQAATDDYRADSDIIRAFVADACVEGPELKVSAKDAYAAFKQWCQDNGEELMSQKRFGLRLGERPGLSASRTGHQRWWQGLGLVTQPSLSQIGSDA